jgi:hypothetical protein
VIGRGQTAGAAADDGHPLAGQGGGLLELEVLLVGGVTDELLNGIDADEVLHLVAVAAGLARRGAHTPHHRRERVRAGQTAEGILLHAHLGRRLLDAAHDLQPAPDVLARGAGTLAGGRTMHVDRALVGVIALEDRLFPAAALVIPVAESPERQFHVIAGSRHALSPGQIRPSA